MTNLLSQWVVWVSAAHWASWADIVAMGQERHPEVQQSSWRSLTHHTAATSINSVQQCQRRLVGAGFELPTWDRLVEGQRPSASDDDEGSWGGWQQKASEKLERDHFFTVRPTLTEPEQAMVLSQGGLSLGRAFGSNAFLAGPAPPPPSRETRSPYPSAPLPPPPLSPLLLPSCSPPRDA